jgi:hypothetical protein
MTRPDFVSCSVVESAAVNVVYAGSGIFQRKLENH